MPVVLSGKERGHRCGASIHEDLRVVLDRHQEQGFIARGVQGTLHRDVVRSEDVHRHDLVQHQIVAAPRWVVVAVVLDRYRNGLVRKHNGTRGVRQWVEVRGRVGIAARIGLTLLQRDGERDQCGMSVHRHGRVDHHQRVVLGGNDVERGERQIGVVGGEVVVVERRVLVERDVELGAQTVGALQRHDVRVVRVTALVVARDVGRGPDAKTRVAHTVGGARFQLGLQRRHIVACRPVRGYVQHDRCPPVETRVRRLVDGDHGRSGTSGHIEENGLVTRRVVPQRDVRWSHPELRARLCLKQPACEQQQHQQCLFHS